MFDSGISVKNLIDEVISEADIALEIPITTYVTWLNALQQVLYSEIIKEQKKITLKSPLSNPIDITLIVAGNGEDTPRFEDIYTIYADDTQLIKSTLTSGVIFPDTFYKNNNNIGYNVEENPSEFTIVYFVRPALIETNTHGNVNSTDVKVMLPIEFIDLAKAKLRGEAYKLANEDNLAAKWLNDYNTLLETFKAWIIDKTSNFGM
jgi:hypothetical protein